jgi:hypothetical protein
LQVPPQVNHSERSEVQRHDGDRLWGRSLARSCELMDMNWIEGAHKQGGGPETSMTARLV